MSIRSIKEIYQLLEEQLRKSTKPMTCVDLMDIPDTRNEALAEYGKDIRIATNKLSDALGLTWRRNLLVRYPAPRETNTLARYAYSWDFKQDAQESVPIPSPVVSRKTSINCSNAVILESGAHGREKSESWRRLSMGRRRISHLSCSERSTCTPKPTISFNRHNFTECLVC